MKSKTILSEAERRGIVAQLKGASCYKNSGEFILNALVAAEEEIDEKHKTILSQISELEAYEKELEERRLIIERLHNENQALIKENEGLKAELYGVNDNLKEETKELKFMEKEVERLKKFEAAFKRNNDNSEYID